MLQIGNTIISNDLIRQRFSCNLECCKGVCCVKGDSGAPLAQEEAELLESIFDKLSLYMSEDGIKAIEKDGFFIIDTDNDLVTPLIKGKECAYTFFDNDIARCAIEKAYLENKINFRKPVSCHLYPVRIKKYKNFDAVNYEKWDECNSSISFGEKNNIPLYIFVKEALIRKYGDDWFEQLDYAVRHLECSDNYLEK